MVVPALEGCLLPVLGALSANPSADGCGCAQDHADCEAIPVPAPMTRQEERCDASVSPWPAPREKELNYLAATAFAGCISL